jgi:putative ubiquitin-RnfH superfamily antitoxin RatB of RatAB toxin-antitoxin module
MAEEAALQVTVLYSPAPRQVLEWTVALGPGSTAGDALQASGLPGEVPDLDWRQAPVALWGRRARLAQPLRDGDRLEVLRPLRVDPKVARRERFRTQGARAAGLFARNRALNARDEKTREP